MCSTVQGTGGAGFLIGGYDMTTRYLLVLNIVACFGTLTTACEKSPILFENTEASSDFLDPVPDGEIAYYRMRDGSGTELKEWRGKPSATIHGEKMWRGNFLDFDGIDDYVNIPLEVLDELNGSPAMTMAAWFTADGFDGCDSDDCRLISKANGIAEQQHDFMLSTIRKQQQIHLRFRLNTDLEATRTLIADRGNILSNEWSYNAKGNWHHAAAVYDGANKRMRLYLGGREVGNKKMEGNIALNLSRPIWIGGNPSDAQVRPWKGRITRVRFYDRALDECEVRKLALTENDVDYCDADGQAETKQPEPEPKSEPNPNTKQTGDLSAIKPHQHPHLYFTQAELDRIRQRKESGQFSPAAKAAWKKVRWTKNNKGELVDLLAVTRPSDFELGRARAQGGFKPRYKLLQWRGKQNMNAAMSYAVEPTCNKQKAMKKALLSYLDIPRDLERAQIGGHIQFVLPWMFDLLYNAKSVCPETNGEPVLNKGEKTEIYEFMGDVTRRLTKAGAGVDRKIGCVWNPKQGRYTELKTTINEDKSVVHEVTDRRCRLHDEDKLIHKDGYDNFYTLDVNAAVTMALMSGDQALVNRLEDGKVYDDRPPEEKHISDPCPITNIPDDDFLQENCGLKQHAKDLVGGLRSFWNIIGGATYKTGYLYDGYKRVYGFDPHITFAPGEFFADEQYDAGEGQHYHFFSLLGVLPMVISTSLNGADTWSYLDHRILETFKTGAPWAHTAFRVTDNEGEGGDRNHTPLYWIVQKEYPNDCTIRAVTSRSESRATYGYFFSDVAPIWAEAGPEPTRSCN